MFMDSRRKAIDEALLNGIKSKSQKLFVPFAMTQEEMAYILDKLNVQKPEDEETLGDIFGDISEENLNHD